MVVLGGMAVPYERGTPVCTPTEGALGLHAFATEEAPSLAGDLGSVRVTLHKHGCAPDPSHLLQHYRKTSLVRNRPPPMTNIGS